jgi:hypothetical protein
MSNQTQIPKLLKFVIWSWDFIGNLTVRQAGWKFVIGILKITFISQI